MPGSLAPVGVACTCPRRLFWPPSPLACMLVRVGITGMNFCVRRNYRNSQTGRVSGGGPLRAGGGRRGVDLKGSFHCLRGSRCV
eukprot:4256452-Pyramimonas_sp.AAC.1